MKINFQKIIILIIVFALALSFVGCKKETDNIDPNNSQKEESEVNETDIWLVKNTATEFKLVIPENADSYLKEAASELRIFFKMAANTEPIVITDKDFSWTEEAKIISLGQTQALKQSGLSAGGSQLGSSDGFEIRSKGKSVFIAGGGSLGTLFGVYKFLNFQFGFEAYSNTEIAINSISSVKLLNFQVKEIPDFSMRIAAYSDQYPNDGNKALSVPASHRMYLNTDDDIWIKIGGKVHHNTFELVSPDEYKAEHPDWFSAETTQLCFTQDVEGLSAVVIEKMKQEIVNQPYGKIISISQEDGNTWCGCSTCSAMREKYGTDAASQLLFNNVCAKEINRWLKASKGDSLGAYTDDYFEKYGVNGETDREITIGMFAYCRTESAPAKKVSDTEYATTIDVALENNLAVFYAPITANWNYTITHEKNSSNFVAIKGWDVTVKNIWMWPYSLSEQSSLVPLYGIYNQQQNYKLFLDNGTQFIFEEGVHAVNYAPDWQHLKAYITSKLMWDVNANVPLLIDMFMEQYYGPAADSMKNIFEKTQDWMLYSANVLGRPGNVANGSVADETFWPMSLLLEFIDNFDRALGQLTKLKASNPFRANTLADRIEVEAISYRYMLLKNYKSLYPSNIFSEMKAQLIKDVRRLGIGQGVSRYGLINGVIDAL